MNRSVATQSTNQHSRSTPARGLVAATTQTHAPTAQLLSDLPPTTWTQLGGLLLSDLSDLGLKPSALELFEKPLAELVLSDLSDLSDLLPRPGEIHLEVAKAHTIGLDPRLKRASQKTIGKWSVKPLRSLTSFVFCMAR
jgi:hypothetical protein